MTEETKAPEETAPIKDVGKTIAEQRLEELLAESPKPNPDTNTPPMSEAPKELDPNETIKIVEEPSRLPNVPREFTIVQPNDPILGHFPPPPPMADPTGGPSVQSGLIGSGGTPTMVGSLPPMIPAGKVMQQGILSEPPTVVPTEYVATVPPEWESLSEKTKAELMAGRKATGGVMPLQYVVTTQPLEKAQSKLIPPAQEAVPFEPQQGDPLTWEGLSEATKAEMRAGRATSEQRRAETRQTMDLAAERNAAKLKAGGRATGDELDYPRG